MYKEKAFEQVYGKAKKVTEKWHKIYVKSMEIQYASFCEIHGMKTGSKWK